MLHPISNLIAADREKAPSSPAGRTPGPQPHGTTEQAPPQTNVSPLTVQERQDLAEHLRPCWNFPVEALNADKLVVEIRVTMNPDGTTQKAHMVNTSRMSDPYYRAAAEAALRATLNPQCQPYRLPPEKYALWKTFVITFDPSDL